MMKLLLLLALAFAASTSTTVAAQTASPIQAAPEGVTQELRLRDGTTAYGRVEAVTDDRVIFRTLAGATLEIAPSDVLHLAPVDGRVAGAEFWKADPNPTRLFFGPTGRALKRGDAYLGVYEVYLPFVQVGVTDSLSVGAGTPLFFGGGGPRPFWLTPKLTVYSRGQTSAAAGVMHIMNVDGDSLGIAYGVVTQGSADTAVTIGAGYAYERYENNGAPIVMLGGEHRVRRNLKLVTENYVFEGGGIASAGVRFLTGRLSADLGLATPLGIDVFLVFPVVNFVWTFR